MTLITLTGSRWLRGARLAAGAIALGTRAVAASDASVVLDPARIDAAVQKAAACLAADHDGAAFNDPYLQHLYAEEDLPQPETPPGGRRITYRMVDADIILALIGRAGAVPADLMPAFDLAQARLRSLVPLWRQVGLRNIRRSVDPRGVALDTYCAVGWLHGDASMGRTAESALDGDRWLPEGFYEGQEGFRALADEAWCLSLLASTRKSLGRAEALFDRLTAEFRREREHDPLGRGTFHEAWHLGMVIHELAGPDRWNHESADGPSLRALRADVLDTMSSWSSAHGGVRASRRDVLEWANLAAADLLETSEGRSLRETAVEQVLHWQDEDGCWSVPGASPPRRGRSFLTLRAVLALQPYRGAGSAPPTSTGGPSPEPGDTSRAARGAVRPVPAP